MTRFRCPSTSTATSHASLSRESTYAPSRFRPVDGAPERLERMQAMPCDNTRVPVHSDQTGAGSSRLLRAGTSRRARSGLDLSKKKEIADAIKRERHRSNIKKSDLNCIFVGNLSVATSEGDLRNMFSTCGEILKVSLRSSRGTQGVVLHKRAGTVRDRQYAVVEFKHTLSVSGARVLDGHKLHFLPMKVCMSVADLPEVQDVLRRHMNQIQSRRGKKVPAPRTKSYAGPLLAESTEIDLTYIEPVNARALRRDGPGLFGPHSLMNLSFQKTLI